MRHVFVLPLLVVGLLSSAVHASGAIYKWVDQKGVTQYSQTPPPKNAKSRSTVRVSKHVPADVREGRVRPLSGLDAVTEANPNTDNTANNNSAAPVIMPAPAPVGDQAAPPVPQNSSAAPTTNQSSNSNSNNSSGNTGINTPAQAPVQSSTVPSAPVPLVTARPEQF